MLPLLGRIAPRLVVKLSPLFDVDEVFRVFGAGATHNPNHTGEQGVSGLSGDKKGADDMSSDTHTHVTTPSVVSVDVVSLAGECKEIVAEISFTDHVATPTIRAVMVGVGEIEFPFGDGWTAPPQEFTPEHYKWLVVPDVALQKSRLARRYFSERGISKQEDSREPAGSAGGLCDIYIDSDNGYGFAEVGTDAKTGTIAANTTSSANAEMEQSPLTKFNGLLSESGNKRLQERDALPNRTELPESIGLPGRIFEIESIEPFDPKALKRHLKAAGIKNIDIMRRKFPLSTANIAHQIGVREGGEKKLAFTKAAERLWQVTLT
jgi:hypothetical protein